MVQGQPLQGILSRTQFQGFESSTELSSKKEHLVPDSTADNGPLPGLVGYTIDIKKDTSKLIPSVGELVSDAINNGLKHYRPKLSQSQTIAENELNDHLFKTIIGTGYFKQLYDIASDHDKLLLYRRIDLVLLCTFIFRDHSKHTHKLRVRNGFIQITAVRLLHSNDFFLHNVNLLSLLIDDVQLNIDKKVWNLYNNVLALCEKERAEMESVEADLCGGGAHETLHDDGMSNEDPKVGVHSRKRLRPKRDRHARHREAIFGPVWERIDIFERNIQISYVCNERRPYAASDTSSEYSHFSLILDSKLYLT